MITRKVAGRVYNFGYCIGNASPGGKGFEYPVGLSLGSGGNLYVLSRSLMNVPGWGITKCTVDHEFIWEDRGPNFGGRLSRWPRGVAVDRADNVYVSDDFANVIFLYDADGNFQGNWGTEGSGDGQLRSPNGLAVDNEGNIFVVDSLNHRIQKFTRDGTFLAKWGRRGSGKGEFNMPWGIAVHDGGDVYVADWKNDRVQKFTAGGEYLATFGGPGTSEGELKLPSDVAVDDDGGRVRHRLGQRQAQCLCSRWDVLDGILRRCRNAVGVGPGRGKRQPRLPEGPAAGRPDARKVVLEADGSGRGPRGQDNRG